MQKYLLPVASFSVDCYDEVPLWSAPFGLQLLEKINYKKGLTALDIGFGNGFPLTELAMRLGETSVVYGIDPWEEAIERTRRKIHCYEISNIRIIKGVAESIPLATSSVDLITSNNGMNNVKDMNASLAECARILKPGGQFVQTMNLDKSMIEFYQALEETLTALNMPETVLLMRQHIYEKRKPLEEVTAMVQQHGFDIRSIEQHQFHYRFADATAMLNHYFIRLAFMDAWKKFVPEEKISNIFDMAEEKMNRQASSEGGFALRIPFMVMDAVRKK